jgi:hypothetical protein
MPRVKSTSNVPEDFLDRTREEQNLVVDSFELLVEGTDELDSDPRCLLFDTEEEYRIALLARTELRDPLKLLRHELAHAECAKAVGFTAIRYGLIYDDQFEGDTLVKHGVAVLGGSVTLPNIAYASTFVAPSDPSYSDIQNMRRHAYHSVQYLSERIELWNNSDHGLLIPMPGSFDIGTV